MIKKKSGLLFKQKILLVLFIFYVQVSFCQELPVYRQYMLNYFFINPAYSGIEGCNSIRFTNRSQWLGINNAPLTNTLSLNSRIADEGIGAYVFSHSNGPFQDWGGHLAYAHHILIPSNSRKERWPHLSFGIAVRYQKKSFDSQNLDPLEPNDLALKGVVESGGFGNFDAGAIYYTDFFFLSLSANQILQQKIKTFENANEPKTPRYITISAAYRFQNIKNSYAFEPSIMFKTFVDGRKMLDLNFKIYLLDIIWIAGSYRNNLDSQIGKSQGFIGYLNLSLLNSMRIAYGYDFGFNNMEEHYFGSHEIMFSYQFCVYSKKGAVKCPAYFH